MQDSGVGIAPEDISKLFTRFGKLERSSQMNSNGIGLGLTIVKQIVEQSGGTISVESNGPGTGSLFIFSMHLAQVLQPKLQLCSSEFKSTHQSSKECFLNRNPGQMTFRYEVDGGRGEVFHCLGSDGTYRNSNEEGRKLQFSSPEASNESINYSNSSVYEADSLCAPNSLS